MSKNQLKIIINKRNNGSVYVELRHKDSYSTAGELFFNDPGSVEEKLKTFFKQGLQKCWNRLWVLQQAQDKSKGMHDFSGLLGLLTTLQLIANPPNTSNALPTRAVENNQSSIVQSNTVEIYCFAKTAGTEGEETEKFSIDLPKWLKPGLALLERHSEYLQKHSQHCSHLKTWGWVALSAGIVGGIASTGYVLNLLINVSVQAATQAFSSGSPGVIIGLVVLAIGVLVAAGLLAGARIHKNHYEHALLTNTDTFVTEQAISTEKATSL